MYEKFGSAHSLDGFPAAALIFMRALDSNRHRIAKEAGVTGSELRALSRVAEAGSITPKELADSMEMTTGAVTAISTRLVDATLMRRVDHPNDRRSLLLELTPSGDEVMKQIYREFDAALAVVTKDIAEADLRGCSTLLRSAAEELVPLDTSVF
ncbi:MarR family transcriptional regulator [Glaciihabitans sp. GrIS 2.15]|uniref:MarR family transcriptional regulator n=1 Tax=Glaciihabitans sp. GrIS 2.15 TaxID=3071710 RepID=UPI002E0B9E01|nr:DNA-binding MarR family transcriptional regulator [Glaciihabitans sp. GrIS 2.15]